MSTQSIQIVFMLFFLCVAGISCKQPDKTPELRDPIYADLIRDLGEADREVESIIAELEGAEKDYLMSEAQTGEIKVRRQAIFDIKVKLDKARQTAKYASLEVERRRLYARTSYLKAFNREKEWPNKSEYKAFLANRRLANTPKNYDETHRKRLDEARAPASSPKKASSGH